jgi:hypothetical protein
MTASEYLILPVDRFRALLRAQCTERPALADEIDSEEWFLKRQRGAPLEEGTTEGKEFVAAVEALNTLYQRVRVSEVRLRGTPDDGVGIARDIDPTEQAIGVSFNIWTREFDCRSQDFSGDTDARRRRGGHLYRNVWCYVDPEPQPLATQRDEPTVADPAPGTKGGRRQYSFWPEVENYVFDLLVQHGPPSPDDPELPKQNALEDLVAAFMQQHGWGAAESTIREHVVGMLEYWGTLGR